MKKVNLKLMGIIALALSCIFLMSACTSSSASNTSSTENVVEQVDNTICGWSTNSTTDTENGVYVSTITTPEGTIYSLPYMDTYEIVAVDNTVGRVYLFATKSLNGQTKFLIFYKNGRTDYMHQGNNVYGYYFLPEEGIMWWWSDAEWTGAGTVTISSDIQVITNPPCKWFG